MQFRLGSLEASNVAAQVRAPLSRPPYAPLPRVHGHSRVLGLGFIRFRV